MTKTEVFAFFDAERAAGIENMFVVVWPLAERLVIRVEDALAMFNEWRAERAWTMK